MAHSQNAFSYQIVSDMEKNKKTAMPDIQRQRLFLSHIS